MVSEMIVAYIHSSTTHKDQKVKGIQISTDE